MPEEVRIIKEFPSKKEVRIISESPPGTVLVMIKGELRRMPRKAAEMAREAEAREIHHCWKCGEPFPADNAEYCEACGTLKCNSSHHCLCSLGEEARLAVEREITSLGLWEHHSGGRRKKRFCR